MIPDHFQLQYSKEEIDREVARLGDSISAWSEQVWAESHTDVVTIPVLRGGIFFFADLVRKISNSVEISPAQSWGYQPAVNLAPAEEVRIRIADEVAVKGRSVLLIDDICDSGRTLRELSKVYRERGALEVRSAVLIRRDIPDQAYQPDWTGFVYKGEEWFVGYGMEDSDRWRNLPDIYIIKQQAK